MDESMNQEGISDALARKRRHAWDCAQINDLAKRDFIDPPIGLALRDVLAGLNGKMVGAVYQVIRW